MDTTSPSYRGYRFPVAIIAHCTWLYFRFCLSFRDVQEMMLERGFELSYETVRLWTLKFGDETPGVFVSGAVNAVTRGFSRKPFVK